MSFYSTLSGRLPMSTVCLGLPVLHEIVLAPGCYAIDLTIGVGCRPVLLTVGSPDGELLVLHSDVPRRSLHQFRLPPVRGQRVTIARRWRDPLIVVKFADSRLEDRMTPLGGFDSAAYVECSFVQQLGPIPSAIDQLGSIAG